MSIEAVSIDAADDETEDDQQSGEAYLRDLWQRKSGSEQLKAKSSVVSDMDLGTIAKGVERLSEADAMIADQYLRAFLFRTGVFALAGGIALCGLALWELSVFWLLEPKIGSLSASTILGAVNCTITSLLLLAMKFKPPAAEVALAIKLRHAATSQLQQELATHKIEDSSYPLRPAIELAAALLVPMATALVRSIRTHTDVSTSNGK